MAGTRLLQLSALLYLTILFAAEVSFQNVQQGNRESHQRLMSHTKCSLGPFRRNISCTHMGLTDVPQDLYPGVVELDLSDNKIQFLLNTSFLPYQRITKLSLSSNELEEIAPRAFYPMLELQYLDLADNPMLDFITSEMFRLSKNLYLLNFSSCHQISFPSDILRWLPKLQLLDLSFTSLSHINISSCNSAARNLTVDLRGSRFKKITQDTFRIDCQLDFLNLNRCRGFIWVLNPVTIASIRSRSLSLGHIQLSPEIWQYFFTGIGMSEIEELFLKNANVGGIDPHYFTRLRGKLRVLDLSNNKLSNFPQMGFLTLPFLSTLILDRCTIDYIDPTYFSRMKGLRVLHLNFNNIYKIGNIDGNSSWNIELQELYLASNSLEKIHERSFMGLTNLTKLVLRGNKDLAWIFITEITGLNNLKYLDLSGCRLASLILYAPNLQTFVYSNCEKLEFMSEIRGAFNHTKSIKYVFLGNSGINSLWAPYTRNSISLFEGMRNLTTLDVKRNQIELLQEGLFEDLVYLIQLDLSKCQIKYIEKNAFAGLQRLHILYLQDNNFHYLPNKLLMNSGQLRNIRLDGNKIRYLTKDLFVNKSKLQNLTLADNRLTLVNHSTFQPILNTLSFIDISSNELGCTCDLKWLPIWLRGSITLLNENATRCSPSSILEIREKPLMSFKPADFCGPNIALYSSLPFLITWVVVIGIFAYRHRWFLKYKLFLLKLAVIGYREIQDARDIDDFEFHLNVMFADEDEDWVRNRLCPVLQEQLPEYNRCVYGDNDLPLGMHYCDAVHYVVEMSYKTVMVISRAAIQDNWFVIKFRTAADHVNDTQVENMIVIFLEDIPDDELPFLVRLYLSDRNPYLSWEEDEGFQEYFWQTLIKMLKINFRVNNVIPPE